MMVGIKELISPLYQADCVVLTTHIKPDGDALGSLLGLADILQQMGKTVCCYLEEEVPLLFQFLPGWRQVEISFDAVRNFVNIAGKNVLIIALDCGDMQRLGKWGPKLRQMHPFIVIDHHKANNGFGDLSWVEPDCSSTGEMICDLAEAMGQAVSAAAATCLYTAIATDTGSFCYEATTSHTYRVVAGLVDAGACPGEINEKLYNSYPLGRLHLMQQVLATLKMFADERIAVIFVSEEMFEQTGTTVADTENFINLVRTVKTVQVSVFIKESNRILSVSLRSRSSCDVALVAAHFGGGGHARASGFRKNDVTVDELRAQLLPVLIRQLDN
jgi:phosphoesterase RecJ-like protein